ncbi:hypothetical protein MMPV_000521 [Pyropia vietnamensis]
MADPPGEPVTEAVRSATETAAAGAVASAAPPGVAGVVAPGGAGPPSDGEDSFAFLVELHRVPCFRESVLYGGGGGALLGALHWQRTRTCSLAGARSSWTGVVVQVLSVGSGGTSGRATDVAVKASLVFASAYWCVPDACRVGGGL